MNAAQILKDTTDQYRAAFEQGRAAERTVLDFIVRIYDEVKNDPTARIPTALGLAIEHARAA